MDNTEGEVQQSGGFWRAIMSSFRLLWRVTVFGFKMAMLVFTVFFFMAAVSFFTRNVQNESDITAPFEFRDLGVAQGFNVETSSDNPGALDVSIPQFDTAGHQIVWRKIGIR